MSNTDKEKDALKGILKGYHRSCEAALKSLYWMAYVGLNLEQQMRKHDETEKAIRLDKIAAFDEIEGMKLHEGLDPDNEINANAAVLRIYQEYMDKIQNNRYGFLKKAVQNADK